MEKKEQNDFNIEEWDLKRTDEKKTEASAKKTEAPAKKKDASVKRRKQEEDDWEEPDFLEDEEPARRSIVPMLIALLLILLIGGIAVGAKLYEKYSYSKEVMSLAEYYGISEEGKAAVLLADEVIEEQALVIGSEYYLPLSLVQEQLNSRFYYAAGDGLLLYTTPTELYEFAPDSPSYTVDGEERSHSCAIFVMREQPYVNAGFLTAFANFVMEVYTEPDRIQLYTQDQTHLAAEVGKATNIRYQGGVKSPILEPLQKGDKVFLLEEMENWSKVKSEDGVIGYVENKLLSGLPDETVEMPVSYVAPAYTSIHKDYVVNMAWHQVTNEAANGGVDELLANTRAVNTISPTWFFLNDNAGNFTSIASSEYVDKMHARGIEVWALIDNFTNDVDIAQILGKLANRKNLISNLTQTALSYNIDGINIDFEQVPAEAGGDYVQFLRELSIACRENGLVLSVDNYVPTGYTAHYDRKEQGTVVDYVVIMGYDEHYAGSPEAGSVSSIDYVRQGIENTVSVVPAEKVINGIPFYTRLWKIDDSGVTSEALSMSAAENYLTQYGVTAVWDQVTSQNFAQWEDGGATYQIWLEDTQSLAAKLSVMSMYPLGGVAQWKLGLEKPEVWELIESYVQGGLTSESQDTQADALDEGSAGGEETEMTDSEETEMMEIETE